MPLSTNPVIQETLDTKYRKKTNQAKYTTLKTKKLGMNPGAASSCFLKDACLGPVGLHMSILLTVIIYIHFLHWCSNFFSSVILVIVNISETFHF
jgi:hypothetical protein